MGRRRQPQIAEAILDRCTDHSLEHGLPTRLSTLAEASGTSSRMLVYHFGNRDELVRLVLQRARQRQLAFFGDLLRTRDGEAYVDTLRAAWHGMTGENGVPYLRMFRQLRADVEQDVWPGFARTATLDWLAPLEHGLSTLGAAHLATLTLAVIRGLIMDLDDTADRDRADTAFEEFVQLLESNRGSPR